MSTPFKKLITSLIRRNAIKRGPTSSDAWNDSVEELSNDLSRLASTWNTLLFPLLDSLPNGTDDLNAFSTGLDGKAIYVDQDAVLNVADNKYFNTVHSRPNSVKDQFEAVYTKIATTKTDIETEITNQSGALTQGQKDSIGAHIFDSGATSSSTSLDGKSENSRLNDNQLAKDLYGGTYTLDNDGNANLTNSVKDMVNALLLIHNGSWSGDVTVDHAALSFGDFKSDGTVVMTASLKGANGTVGAPSFAFSGDTDMGFYKVAEDQLGVSVGGINTLIFGTGGQEITPVDGSLNIIGSIAAGTAGSIFAGTSSGDLVTSGNGYGLMANGHGRIIAVSTGVAAPVTHSTPDNSLNNSSSIAHTFNSAVTLSVSGGKLVSIQNNTVEKLYIDFNGSLSQVSGAGIGVGGAAANANQITVPANNGAGFLITGATVVDQRGIQSFNRNAYLAVPDGNTTVTLQSKVTDGSSAVGITLNNGNALATAGAKLLSVQNNGTEKFAFKWDSGLTFNNTIAPAAADWGIGQNGTDLVLNVPTGDKVRVYVNGSPRAYIDVNGFSSNGNGTLGAFYPGATSTVYYSNDATSTSQLHMQSNVPDGGTAVGLRIDTATTLSTAGAKLISIQNNSTEKSYFDLNGILSEGVGAAAATMPVSGTVNVTTTGVGNVGASGPDNLASYTLPASALNTTGKTVRIKAWGTTANNANAKTVALVFGSQTLITKQLTVSVAGTWDIEAIVAKTGSNTQDIYCKASNNNGSTMSSADSATAVLQAAFVLGTQTDTSTIVIKGQSTASTSDNDIIQEGMLVEVMN